MIAVYTGQFGNRVAKQLQWCREQAIGGIKRYGIYTDLTLHGVQGINYGEAQVGPEIEGFCTNLFTVFVNYVQAGINGDTIKSDQDQIYTNTPTLQLEPTGRDHEDYEAILQVFRYNFPQIRGRITNINNEWAKSVPLLSSVMFITRLAYRYQTYFDAGLISSPEKLSETFNSIYWTGKDHRMSTILNRFGRVLSFSGNGTQGLWFVLLLSQMVQNGDLSTSGFKKLLKVKYSSNGVNTWAKNIMRRRETTSWIGKLLENIEEYRIYNYIENNTLDTIFRTHKVLY